MRARDGIHPCRCVRDVRVDDARARGDSHRPIRDDRVEGFPARAPESRSRWIGRRDITQRRPRIAHQRTILLVCDVAGSLRAKARGDAREEDGGRCARAARARGRARRREASPTARGVDSDCSDTRMIHSSVRIDARRAPSHVDATTHAGGRARGTVRSPRERERARARHLARVVDYF